MGWDDGQGCIVVNFYLPTMLLLYVPFPLSLPSDAPFPSQFSSPSPLPIPPTLSFLSPPLREEEGRVPTLLRSRLLKST